MKFVDNAKDCWKWFSMWAMAIAGAIQGGWGMLDSDMRALIPYSETVVPSITAALLFFGIVGRLVDQTKKPE